MQAKDESEEKEGEIEVCGGRRGGLNLKTKKWPKVRNTFDVCTTLVV